ncbi:muconolactone Delta-isomerase family protein [Streptomyces sp. DSM 118148]|uniref:muconolactone Delta-isomerase family protein n=1 Tax=Streptomyces sp. DSM 118148 TaxID=3448667 RepID=UPI0040403019
MPLFAVLATQSPRGISGDEFRTRLPEGFAYTRGLVDKGVIKHNWVRVGAAGGLLIYDVESHEELLGHLYDNPMSPHLTFEVIPLAQAGAFDSTRYTEN